MNNVYKVFVEMSSLEMTNIIMDIRLSKKEGKRAESLVPYAKMISENLNLDPENPTVTMRECSTLQSPIFWMLCLIRFWKELSFAHNPYFRPGFRVFFLCLFSEIHIKYESKIFEGRRKI